MPWIESHAELRDHPKVDALMDALSITRRDAVGLLHMVWWRALTYAPSGDLSAVRDSAIARWCDWEGDAAVLVGGLIDAGFLDDGRQLHDWQDYAGRWIDRREANATRKRNARAAKAQAASGDRPPDVAGKSGATGPNRTLTGPDLTPTPLPPSRNGGRGGGAAAPSRERRREAKPVNGVLPVPPADPPPRPPPGEEWIEPGHPEYSALVGRYKRVRV